MGIELPVELRDLAHQVGARWPEADEDAMRRSASAWRDTASSLQALAGRADSTAQGALTAIDGATADAARRHWDGFVDPDTGDLPVSVKDCTAAADRLDHAAEQIGAAKVRIVRELVVLARNRDAAQQAAAAGNPRALAGLDTLVRGTTASLAQVHQELAVSVEAPPGSGPVSASEVPGRPLTDAVASVPAEASSLADSASTAVTDLVESARPVPDAGQAIDTAGRVADAGVTAATESAPGSGSGESTGPVPREVVSGVAQQVPETPIDAGTGPIPRVAGDAVGAAEPAAGQWDAMSNPAGPSPAVAGHAPDTAPQAVHQAWAAAPPAPAAGMAPGGPAPAPPVAPGSPGYAQAGPYAAPAAGAVGGAPRAAASAPPVAGARPPAAPVYGPPAGHAPAAPRSAFRPGPQPGSPIPPPPNAPPPNAPPPNAPPPNAGAPGDGPPRSSRQPERNSAVLAFVLHQFPLGHMPVAASRPSLQWSTPRPDDDTDCLRFPPQDHPRAALVDDADALARVRSGRAGAPCPEEVQPCVPDHLLEGYDPLGEAEHERQGESPPLSEAEWEQRYLARGGARTHRPEYAWPAWAGHPEGCREAGDPVVLDADTVVDRVGDPDGRVLFADGTPFAERALPPQHRERGYHRYRVMRPLPVRRATAAPWFGQPGGGVRYRTTYSVAELVELGHLAELVGEGAETAAENAQARTLRLTRETVDATDDVGHTEKEAQ